MQKSETIFAGFYLLSSGKEIDMLIGVLFANIFNDFLKVFLIFFELYFIDIETEIYKLLINL